MRRKNKKSDDLLHKKRINISFAKVEPAKEVIAVGLKPVETDFWSRSIMVGTDRVKQTLKFF